MQLKASVFWHSVPVQLQGPKPEPFTAGQVAESEEYSQQSWQRKSESQKLVEAVQSESNVQAKLIKGLKTKMKRNTQEGRICQTLVRIFLNVIPRI